VLRGPARIRAVPPEAVLRDAGRRTAGQWAEGHRVEGRPVVRLAAVR
jgi:hypothetical protein